jgi:hypothetical protein
MMKSKILLVVSLALGVIAIVAYSQFNRKVQGVEKQKVDVEISASELLLSFEENETAANERFLDKVILVEGEIINIERENEKNTVFLESGNDLSRIICQLDESVTEMPNVGEKVKVKGICTGYLMDVVIVRAIFQK